MAVIRVPVPAIGLITGKQGSHLRLIEQLYSCMALFNEFKNPGENWGKEEVGPVVAGVSPTTAAMGVGAGVGVGEIVRKGEQSFKGKKVTSCCLLMGALMLGLSVAATAAEVLP